MNVVVIFHPLKLQHDLLHFISQKNLLVSNDCLSTFLAISILKCADPVIHLQQLCFSDILIDHNILDFTSSYVYIRLVLPTPHAGTIQRVTISLSAVFPTVSKL